MQTHARLDPAKHPLDQTVRQTSLDPPGPGFRRPRGPQQLAVRIPGCLAVLLAVVLVGCSKTPEQLLQQALAAEKAAQSALARNDAKAARRAAEQAGRAESQLKKLAEADHPDREQLRRQWQAAQVAARAARDHAGLAAEKQQRQDKLSGLKVRAYQKARTFILTTVLPQMALAAEKASKGSTNDLSTIERPLAEQSWKLARLVGNRASLPDGTPDWTGTASDLRRWSTNQPLEFRAFLGLAFVLLGQGDFALAEFEGVDADQLGDSDARAIYHGGRALLYALEGWNRLAAPEAEAFIKHADLSKVPIQGEHLVAMFHAFTACEAFQKRDFVRMDAAVAQSIRAWPDNPLAVFLTGEKLAATGEWEKAADSLEARAAGTPDQWIAQRFAQRARDLRDGKGTTKALVFDARYLAEFAAHCAIQAARGSAAEKKIGEIVEEARSFGQDLLRKLPFVSGAAEAQSAPGT